MLFINRVRELPSREGRGPAFPRSPSMSQQASFGQLALTYCGKFLPLEVLQSAAGHYIGTRDTAGPVSRESRDYFRSYRSEEHTSEIQSLMRISYAVFFLKNKILTKHNI